MHSTKLCQKEKDCYKLKNLKIHSVLFQDENVQISVHQVLKRCSRKFRMAMLNIILKKIKIYINSIFKILSKKYNTLFFLKDSQREYGRSFIKWLIVLMFYYMFLMQETLMELVQNSLSNISNINVQINTLFSFWINVIWYLPQLLKNGWNIYQRLHLLWLFNLVFPIHLEKDL